MGYTYKFLREKIFCKHPVEDCVVRTVPSGQFSWETYLTFPGGLEYQPDRAANIVLDVVLATELEFITEEEYYAFGKKRESQLTPLSPSETPERIGGLQSLIIDLACGRKKPANEKERELLKEIKEIEARGGMLDLPLE